MKTLARTFLPLLLGLSAVAVAQQQTAPATPATALATPHYDPRGTTQSVCMAPSVGSCGSCTVSCTTGQFALCSAGVAMNPQAGSACVQAPDCHCR